MLRITLANESVEIDEGTSEAFCAVIEDPMAVLERDVTVFLHTLSDTAQGVIHVSYFAWLLFNICVRSLLELWELA